MEKVTSIIRKQGGKYYVFSEDGSKRLGGPYDTIEAARKRIQVIEYFKHKKGKSAMELGPTPTNKPANHPQDDKDMKKFKKKLDINLQGDPAGDRTKTDLVGTVAGLPSQFIVDKEAHFPISTEDQAKSAISRVLYSMYQAPDWFQGSIDDLRELVCKAVLTKYPKIQVKASVALNEMFAAIATKQNSEPQVERSQATVKSRSELLAEYVAANLENERPETDLGTIIKNPNKNASKVPGITTPTIDYLKEYKNQPVYAGSGVTQYSDVHKLPEPLWGSHIFIKVIENRRKGV